MARLSSWRLYQPEDLAKVEMLDDEKEWILKNADFLAELAKYSDGEHILCGTIFHENKVMGIGGFFEREPGVVEVFCIPDKHMYEHPMCFVRIFQDWIALLETRPWCNRIQSHSLPIKRIDKWMQALGFLYERTLKRYTELGQDYKLWGKDKVNGIWPVWRWRRKQNP